MYQFKQFTGGSGGVTQLGPWDLIISTPPENTEETEEPSVYLKVLPGLIGGVLPSNWNDIFEINSSDIQNITYFSVEVSIDNEGGVTSAEIKTSTEPPDEPNPITPWSFGDKVVILFGVFSRNVRYRTIAFGDIVLAAQLALTTSEATNDSIPFTNYYKIINL